MNAEKTKIIILKIQYYYKNLGGYKFIFPNPHLCAEDLGVTCKIIEGDKMGNTGTGFYHNSITVDPIITSSLNGERLILQPLPIEGLYWIRASQGNENARIIAHIHSYGGQGEKLFAIVAK